MPPYLTYIHIETWKAIWPIIAAVVLLAALSMLIPVKEKKGETFLTALAFASLGMVTGYLTGFSREPAISAVVPAVLSLMGGLMIFLIGKHQESREIVSLSMFLFSLTLLLGSGWGAVMRETSEEYKRFMRETAEEYKRSERYLKQRAFIESEVNEFRENLGLEPLHKVAEKSKKKSN